MSRVAKNKILETIVNVAGSVDSSLGKAVKEATSALDKINWKAAAVGAAVGSAAVAAGKYLFDLGSQFDDVSDAIRIGTGATGEALDMLLNDFDEVYKNVPTSMENAAKAIADYNTYLDLTGTELQDLSKQAIQVSDMVGDDLGGVIQSSSKAFKQWNIDADKMGEGMDFVFKVSQSTGIGFTSLLDTMQQYGPQLQEMGYGFETASVLIGKMEKAGVNTGEILSGLKKGVTLLAKEGISASDGIAYYYEQIKNAGTAAEATAIASELFGSKAGLSMANAIRDGTLAVGDLTAQIMDNGETINGLAEETYGYSERIQMFKQKIQIALKPMANTVFEAINKVLPFILTAITNLATFVIPKMSRALSSAFTKVKPVLIWLKEKALSAIIAAFEFMRSTVLPAVRKKLQEAFEAAQPALNWIKDTAMPKVAEIFNDFKENILPVVQEKLALAFEFVSPILENLGDNLFPAIQTAIQTILDVASKVYSFFKDNWTWIEPIVWGIVGAFAAYEVITIASSIGMGVMNGITAAWNVIVGIGTGITTAFGAAIAFLTSPIGIIIVVIGALIAAGVALYKNWDTVCEFMTGIFDKLKEAIGKVGEFFTGIWEGMKEGFSAVGRFFENIGDSIGNIFKNVVNFFIDGINIFLGGINKLKIPDWVPVVGGKGITIPLIPRFAAGGFTDGLSFAGEEGVEAVISFNPIYREQNIGYWAEAGAMLGVYDRQNNPLDSPEVTNTLSSYNNSASGLLPKNNIQAENPFVVIINFDNIINIPKDMLVGLSPGNQESSLSAQTGHLIGSADESGLNMLSGYGGATIIYDLGGVSFSPHIEVRGDDLNENTINTIIKKIKAAEPEFFDYLEEWLRVREAGRYESADSWVH